MPDAPNAAPARPGVTAPETCNGKFREGDPARPGASPYCSCGAWWTGTSRAHCPAAGCHRTFSSDTAADRHRRGRFGADRRCIHPAEAGLIPAARPYGTLWSLTAAAAPYWDRDAE